MRCEIIVETLPKIDIIGVFLDCREETNIWQTYIFNIYAMRW